MSDPRITPDPALIQFQRAARIAAPVTDLCRAPNGARDRQLVFGDPVTHLADASDWAYVQSQKDGYCGYVKATALAAPAPADVYVSAPATHAYAAPDIKSPDTCSLSFLSRVSCTGPAEGPFAQTELGFIPRAHLRPMADPMSDPAAVAALFLGTPYLWGGNSRWGIDCSGLVQAALLACGIPCPGDSDMQMEAFQDINAADLRHGDLVFWKGHVGMMQDNARLIHANAHHMMVATEPLDAAIDRIGKREFGEVIGYRRPESVSV